jgi:hypothetical protein
MQDEPQESQPDWLDELGDQAEETPASPVPSREVDPAGFLAGDYGEDDTDDWLAKFSTDQPAPSEGEEPSADETVDKGDDWLGALGAEHPEPEAAEVSGLKVPSREADAAGFLAGDFGEDDTDDWLTSLSKDQPAPAAEEADDDDFSAMFGEEAEEPAVPATPQPDTIEPADQEDEGMAWLESLAAKQGVAEEELVTSPDERESLGDDYTPSFFTEEEPGPAADAEEPDPATMFGEPEPAPASEAEDGDDLSMDWLDSISREAAAEAAAGVDQEATAADDAEALDFLQQLGAEPEAAGQPDEDDLSSLFGEPEAEPEAAPLAYEAVDEDEDDFSMDWLDSISQEAAAEAAEGDEALEEAPTPQPEVTPEPEDDLAALFGTDQEITAEAGDEEALDWLQELGGEPAAEAPSTDDDDLSMDWLDSFGEEAEERDIAEKVPEAQQLEEPFSTAGADEAEDLFADILGEETEAAPQVSEPAVPEKPQPAAAAPPDIEDEGMAWLESLAAKQGVAEEELVTTPEERTSFDDDRTPDWLKELEEEEAPAAEPSPEAELDDLDALLDEFEETAEPEPAAPTGDVFEEEDDFSMDWLDSISQEAAAEAGAEDETTEEDTDPSTGELTALLGEESAPPGLTSEPEPGVEESQEKTLRLEDLADEVTDEDTEPEWLKIIKEEKAPSPPQEEPAAEELPEEAAPEEAEAAEPAAEAEILEAEPTKPEQDVLEDQDDFSTEWLDSISQEAAAEAGAEGEEQVFTPVDRPAAGVPDWLSEIEEEDEEVDIGEGLDSLDEIFGAEEEFTPEPSEVEPKSTLVPEWLQEIADEKPESEPAPEPEWLPEVEEPAVQPEIKAESEPAIEELPEEPPTPPVEAAPIPTAPPSQPGEAIIAARRAVQSGNLDEAIKQFNSIIKKGKQLEDLIAEIKEALRRHPVNVELWQALGDAYMKENNLQDALDAYSKAENLLR